MIQKTVVKENPMKERTSQHLTPFPVPQNAAAPVKTERAFLTFWLTLLVGGSVLSSLLTLLGL